MLSFQALVRPFPDPEVFRAILADCQNQSPNPILTGKVLHIPIYTISLCFYILPCFIQTNLLAWHSHLLWTPHPSFIILTTLAVTCSMSVFLFGYKFQESRDCHHSTSEPSLAESLARSRCFWSVHCALPLHAFAHAAPSAYNAHTPIFSYWR